MIMTKGYLLMLLIVCTAMAAEAQKVEFKGGKVLVNDTAILSYEKTTMRDEYSYRSLTTSDEILRISYVKNGYGGSTTVYFPQNFVNFESTTLFYGVDSRPIVKKLVKAGVLTRDGTVDYVKVQEFRKRYEIEE